MKPLRIYKIIDGLIDSPDFLTRINAAAEEGFSYVECITFPPRLWAYVVMEKIDFAEVIDEGLDAIEQKSE